jgi:hypothetical protein
MSKPLINFYLISQELGQLATRILKELSDDENERFPIVVGAVNIEISKR